MRIILLLSLLALSIYGSTQTAKLDTLKIEFNKTGKVSFASFSNKKQNHRLQDPKVFLKEFLRHPDTEDFKIEKSFTDELGMSHILFQRYFRGIAVEGSTYFLHGRNTNVEHLNGDYEDIRINSVIPKLTELQALQAALDQIKATTYQSEDKIKDGLTLTVNNKIVSFRKAELLISKGSDDIWRLSYKFIIRSLNPFRSDYVYVDAKTGQIIKILPTYCTTNANGTGDTRYSGTQNIVTDSNTGGFRLRESRNNVSVTTFNSISPGWLYLANDFTDNDNSWTAAEHDNADHDNAGLDVHWGVEQVLDYWRTVRGRNSINDSGLQITSWVHWGIHYDNAFYEETSHDLTFGDGGSRFTPLTSLDVVAHEMGHGICQYTANLGNSGESGALAEGLSDIWASVIENWSTPSKSRWLIGEDITISPNVALRSMSNPKDPNVINPGPNTFGGTNWVDPSSGFDNGGIHINCGILNFWFYLLTEGKSGTNDNSANYCVSSIGITDAASIVYRAERSLTNSATFSSMRSVSIQAAIDLFGEYSVQTIAVTNAWHAVGVGNKYYTYGTLSASQLNCTTVRFSTAMPLGTYYWQFSGDYTVNSSTAATTSINYVDATGTYGNAYVSGYTACGNFLEASVAFAPFQQPITYVTSMPVIGNDQLSVYINDVNYATNYKWYINGNLADQGSRIFCTCYIGSPTYCGQNNTIEVVAETTCGTYSVAYEYFDWYCGSGLSKPKNNDPAIIASITKETSTENDKYRVYPNPAKNVITVLVPESKLPTTVRFINSTGQMLQTINNVVMQAKIPVSHYPGGIYVVEIINNRSTVKKKIIVTH
ncbi:MAG: M4 family metallopeptidase [Chitinophagaceae bacterium]|nr:M4 family metallopeptidase [Chitinophagaceae bacterium]MDP3665452.1 M4 family metallopeptidase [Sediminibacterium sp.]